MPVIVKTPAHPVLVSPPAPGAVGEWRSDVGSGGVRATFHGPGGELLGFALTGDRLAEKKELQPQLPPVLA
jgi:rubredoxin-NAD+ reductase